MLYRSPTGTGEEPAKCTAVCYFNKNENNYNCAQMQLWGKNVKLHINVKMLLITMGLYTTIQTTSFIYCY